MARIAATATAVPSYRLDRETFKRYCALVFDIAAATTRRAPHHRQHAHRRPLPRVAAGADPDAAAARRKERRLRRPRAPLRRARRPARPRSRAPARRRRRHDHHDLVHRRHDPVGRRLPRRADAHAPRRGAPAHHRARLRRRRRGARPRARARRRLSRAHGAGAVDRAAVVDLPEAGFVDDQPRGRVDLRRRRRRLRRPRRARARRRRRAPARRWSTRCRTSIPSRSTSWASSSRTAASTSCSTATCRTRSGGASVRSSTSCAGATASTADALAFCALHPGGRRILEDLDADLGLAGKTEPSWDVLRDYGNLSSATVLFVLDEVLRRQPPPVGAYGLLAAFGPGFSAELSLMRWE